MPGKTLKIIAVALLMIGTLTSVGAANNKSKQSLRVAVCCGSPPPLCPGSPVCPATKK